LLWFSENPISTNEFLIAVRYLLELSRWDMRKLSFMVVSLIVQLNVFSQSVEFKVGYELAQEILQWEEINSTRKAESDRVFEVTE
jgi:hypothetical protein